MTDLEIQEQAEKMYPKVDDNNVNLYQQDAFVKGAKWMQEQDGCKHRLLSAKNDVIQDGFFCVDCGKLFGEYKRYTT